jgi:hypothetical protein
LPSIGQCSILASSVGTFLEVILISSHFYEPPDRIVLHKVTKSRPDFPLQVIFEEKT